MLHFTTGDATQPCCTPAIICHITNNVGAWGAGFVLALSRRWLAPEQTFRRYKPQLNDISFIQVEESIWVANMCAQNGIGRGQRRVSYNSLKNCLENANKEALSLGATLHMPRIGCGLGGGKWTEIQSILEEIITVDTYIYDYRPQEHHRC